jgi:hypothetical protein
MKSDRLKPSPRMIGTILTCVLCCGAAGWFYWEFSAPTLVPQAAVSNRPSPGSPGETPAANHSVTDSPAATPADAANDVPTDISTYAPEDLTDAARQVKPIRLEPAGSQALAAAAAAVAAGTSGVADANPQGVANVAPIRIEPAGFEALAAGGNSLSLLKLRQQMRDQVAAVRESMPLGAGQKARRFAMSMCRDLRGNLWVGCEPDTDSPTDGGVWCRDSSRPKGKQWTQYTVTDGLGDNSIYAIACDRLGRIWAGHLNHGVSVYLPRAQSNDNGKKWQNYEVVGGISRPDTLSGPLGERVFHITVNPKDGDVWIATNCGLSRYSESKDSWTYYTRADGLPSDQASSIAFDKDGNIYVAMQCDGIAMADSADDYKTWRQVIGPDQLPTTPTGEGLPTNLINDILVAKDGTIYAATDEGLAWSKNKGTSWQFVRGADWADKVRGLYGGPPQSCQETPGAVLAENYCTCLAEDQQSKLWVGHREYGFECVDPASWKVTNLSPSDCYTTCILPGAAGPTVGAYGEGLVQFNLPAKASSNAIAPIAALPNTAAPPSLAKNSSRALDTLEQMTPGSVIAIADDWRTQGAWLGRYGRYWACLAAMATSDYLWGTGPVPVQYATRIGPHHALPDSLRYWVHWLYTRNPRSLEIPPVYLDSRVIKHLTTRNVNRRQSEWDDHGEAYPAAWEGPDVYCTLRIPPGMFTLSLYDMNKDGHTEANRYRDYLVSVRAHMAGQSLTDISGFDRQPELARARISDFWGGVYKRFRVCGPAEITVKVSKGASLNTIVAAVMLDPVEERMMPYFPAVSSGGKLSDPSSVEIPSAASEWAQRLQSIALLRQHREAKENQAERGSELLSQLATAYYEIADYADWERCQTSEGMTTPRQIEKSLRWNKAIPNYSARENLTVMEYWVSQQR